MILLGFHLCQEMESGTLQEADPISGHLDSQAFQSDKL